MESNVQHPLLLLLETDTDRAAERRPAPCVVPVKEALAAAPWGSLRLRNVLTHWGSTPVEPERVSHRRELGSRVEVRLLTRGVPVWALVGHSFC